MTITNPNDQADWGVKGSQAGGVVFNQALTAAGGVSGQPVDVSGTPSTAVTLESTGNNNGFFLAQFYDPPVLALLGRCQINLTSDCAGTIIIPNYGPVMVPQLNLTVLGTPGTEIAAVGIQTGISVGKPTSASIGPILSQVVTIPANTTVPFNTGTITAGPLSVSVFSVATSWSALLYGTSATTDVLGVLSAIAAGPAQNMLVQSPPENTTLALANNDAVPRLFIASICCG